MRVDNSASADRREVLGGCDAGVAVVGVGLFILFLPLVTTALAEDPEDALVGFLADLVFPWVSAPCHNCST